MPNIHNSLHPAKQWAIFLSEEEQPLPSRTKSSHVNCLPSSSPYTKCYQTDNQRWRIADTKAPFDLHKLIDDFGSWYERIVDGFGYQFTASMAQDLPRYFHGNPLMLGFLLWDLGSYSRNFLDGECVDLDIFSKPIGGDWYSIGLLLMISCSNGRRKNGGEFHPDAGRGKKAAGGHTRPNLYYAGIIAGILNGNVNVRNERGAGMEFTAEICLRKSDR